MGGREENLRRRGNGFGLVLLAALIAGASTIATLRSSAQGVSAAKQPGLNAQNPAKAAAGKQVQGKAPKQTSQGQWTAPASLCAPDSVCSVGINAALLYTGEVLYYHYPRFEGGTNSIAVLLNPTTGTVVDVSLPFAEDIFCSGLTIMQDGRVLVAGGDVKGAANPDSGEPFTTIFDPATSTWTQGNWMNYPRWYPSVIGLPDGTTTVISGANATGTAIWTQLENFNPATGVWTTLPASADMPNGTVETYPRLSLLPSGNFVLAAPVQKTYQFSPSTNTWTYVANTQFGAHFYASHVLLPGLEKVMVAGGAKENTEAQTYPPTNVVETIDFSQSQPKWSYTGSMAYARQNLNLVLLADATVLAVAGGSGGGKYTNPVEAAELYNPTSGTWTTMASQQANRTYHSTALLLPDGRVISAGSDNGLGLTQTYEIFSPPYLSNGPRPTISSQPAAISYNTKFTFSFTTPSGTTIQRVALIRPGATTHADDFDQRYVDLQFTTNSKGQIAAMGPPSANYAPPGYYMLVIVNSNGVPAVMPFLSLN
jgi:hypothetical protein